jgi:NAD(P)-dependent dehydrogenase (short-subunit alcohol dehydrogenase family)
MFSPGILKDRVILVTGGGTGIGREMCNKFASLGARIAILGRREDVLRKAAEEMTAAGYEVFWTRCDVRSPEDVTAAVNAVFDHYGRIDVLVNNAAGNFVAPSEKLSPHAVDSVLGIVLHGTIYMTLEVGKRWIRSQQKGVVLNIVTTYAWTGSAFVLPSAAAKAGVLAATRSLAVEWARYGIRHVAIAPGPFPTEATKKNLYPLEGMADLLKERVPLGRFGNMNEITDLASFLVSDYASFITGDVVTIDGGEWLKGAGEFSDLLALNDEQWELIRDMARKKS